MAIGDTLVIRTPYKSCMAEGIDVALLMYEESHRICRSISYTTPEKRGSLWGSGFSDPEETDASTVTAEFDIKANRER
jgi:hypothetical protein